MNLRSTNQPSSREGRAYTDRYTDKPQHKHSREKARWSNLDPTRGERVEVRSNLRQVGGLVPDVPKPHVVDQEEEHVRLAVAAGHARRSVIDPASDSLRDTWLVVQHIATTGHSWFGYRRKLCKQRRSSEQMLWIGAERVMSRLPFVKLHEPKVGGMPK